MNFSLFSSSCEIPSLHSKFIQPKDDMTLLSKPVGRLGGFSKQGHVRALNHDAGRVGVYQYLMPGDVHASSCVGEELKDDEASLEFKYVRTLLIDNYDSYTYNVYQELSVINGVPPVVVHNNKLTWEHIRQYLYKEKAFDNIVISPGPGSPTCQEDIGICWQVLQECKDIPIFGVCLGHQALGYVNGAQIVHAPEPVHGRLSEIEHNGCSLFHDIPSGRNSGFKVMRYHSLVIDADSLPQEVIPIAWSYSGDILPYRGSQKSTGASPRPTRYSEKRGTTKVIMGIMHSKWPHYGVQFHPESIATFHGRQIFENFKKITVDYWSRSSNIHKRKLHNNVWTQMAFASQILTELPESNLSVSNMNRENILKMIQPVPLTPEASDAKFLKLRWKKSDCLGSELGGAKKIFLELFGNHKAENTFWLDSSSTEQKRARFSFMGGKGGSLWKQVTFQLSNRSDNTVHRGGHLWIEDAQGSMKKTFLEDGFLDYLNKELLSFRYEKEDYDELPFDFCGGYVGFIGYDLKVECGMQTNRHKSKTPDACYFFADNIVVIDHWYDDVYILSLHDINHTESQWLDDTERKLLDLRGSITTYLKDKESMLAVSASISEGFHADKSRDKYMKDVEKCLEFIKDGESYELCLTTQLRKKMGNIDSLGLYFELREKNPAPYAAWLKFSNEDLCICCSSPERFLQLDRTGFLEAKPIKGTIARGLTPEEDERLKLQLQCSEKDQAENLMIVDLLRNDLGRVCEAGSVDVHPLMDVESYATVHTLVSTIRGKKRPDVSSVDCVKAAFPGGSMTGAPKLRSMKLLDDLENCSRGVYSGAIGYFSYNQTFDLNIVIRTIVIHEGEASIGAGGAVIALSNPQDEYEEMVLKTRAPVKTVMEYESRSDPDK